MTKTPIHSFLKEYKKESFVRRHMPGHKGVGENAEDLDITEISGADSLFEANGIIEESERIAGESYLNLSRSIKYVLRMCLSIMIIQWFRKKLTLKGGIKNGTN